MKIFKLRDIKAKLQINLESTFLWKKNKNIHLGSTYLSKKIHLPKSLVISSRLSTSHRLVKSSSTVPLTAFGIWSTYCGLIVAFKWSSKILVKKFCNSEPLKNVNISAQSGGLLNFPRFGLSFPASILSAVDLPIPLVPTRPNIWPGLGVGNLCSLNEFGPKRCVVSFSKLLGKLIIDMASNGHFCLGKIKKI